MRAHGWPLDELATEFDMAHCGDESSRRPCHRRGAARGAVIDGKAPGTVSLITGAPPRASGSLGVVVRMSQAWRRFSSGWARRKGTVHRQRHGNMILLLGNTSTTCRLTAGRKSRQRQRLAEVETCCSSCPAAAEPAGDAAGAVRRSESPCPAGARLIFFSGANGFGWRREHDAAVLRPSIATQNTTAFSDFLNIFLFDTPVTTSASLIRALKQTGLFPEPCRAEPDCL